MAHDQLTRDPDVQFLFYSLWKQSGNGFSDMETAAWLVDKGGHYELVLWPKASKALRASWPAEKSVPPGTVAQVHTHPESADPKPSTRTLGENDRVAVIQINQNATQIPVYTVSRKAIWKITPPPELKLQQLAFAGWSDAAEEEMRAIEKQDKLERRLERKEKRLRKKMEKMGL